MKNSAPMPLLDFRLDPRQNLPKWLLLGGLSLVYGLLIRFWLALYRVGMKTSWPAERPVISVGNITLGGTGKTPMVDWLLTRLSAAGLTPAVLTRGYKAQRTEAYQVLNRETAASGSAREFGDEPWLLFSHHPGISIHIAADRIDSARRAAASADILVMDDGMQHLRLARDLDIVLIDTLSGVGNGHLFPLGPLREPLSSLSRADVIIYTKTNLAPSDGVRSQLAGFLAAGTRQFDSTYLPHRLLSLDGSQQPAADLVQKTCLLFSGIGNPGGFSETVRYAGARIEAHIIFDDHMAFNDEPLEKIRQLVKDRPHDYLVCTEKDWVKLADLQLELPTLRCLQMSMEIDPGFDIFLSDWLAMNRKAGTGQIKR